MIAPARTAALAALRAIASGRLDSGMALDRVQRTLGDPRDRALAAEIVLGTLRWRAALDAVIERATSRPLGALDPIVLELLRASAYQVLYLTRTPAHAVVDDAVSLARESGAGRAAGLVNALLRRISAVGGWRSAGLPERPRDGAPREEALAYLSTTLSHPDWLAARWLDRLGFDGAEAWAAFDNEPAPLVLRVNTRRIGAADLLENLAGHGVVVEPAAHAPDGLVVRTGQPLATPLAAQGLFTVQDEASQLVGSLMAGLPGATWLDVCAAPGLKTAAASGAGAGDRPLIVAADKRPRRVALLRRTLASLAVPAHVVRLDALEPLPFRRTFDVVVVDAPCSGLGTLRRDPEVRWRRTAADLVRFAATQKRLLERAATRVAARGYLVYATCTGEPEENDEVIEAFLARASSFRPVDPREVCRALPEGVRRFIDADGRFRTLPPRDGLEAFFAIVLTRQA